MSQDVVAWCVKELKVPEETAEDIEHQLALPSIGVVCVDDIRWLVDEDMEKIDIPSVHKGKIMAWVGKSKP